MFGGLLYISVSEKVDNAGSWSVLGYSTSYDFVLTDSTMT